MIRLLGCLFVFIIGTPLCAQEINWKFEERLESVEKRLDAIEQRLNTGTVKASQSAPTVQPVARVPAEHTHTCANGHTWDHSVTSDHNCPVCGLYQNVQDPVPRPVSLGTVSSGQGYSITGFSSGCSNGSCSAGSFVQPQQRKGILGWRR